MKPFPSFLDAFCLTSNPLCLQFLNNFISLCFHLYFPLLSSHHALPSFSSSSCSSSSLCLAPENWHARGRRCVMQASLTPPTPSQSMSITAKCNGEPCECHQYVTRGDVVTLQTTVSKLILLKCVNLTYIFLPLCLI